MPGATTTAHEVADARGMLLPEDVALIQKYAKDLPPGVVVDLGAGAGTTSLAALQANRELLVDTYDIEQGPLDSVSQLMTNVYLAHRWRGFKMDSLAAAEIYKGNILSMVMLDTSHKYEATVEEIKTWAPLTPLIWFHDYTGPDSLGVFPAVNEAVALGILEIVEAAGWGVVCRTFPQSDPRWR